jgi:hypothetical protein
MRNAPLKRFLVHQYFNAQEVRRALGGMVSTPPLGAPIDYEAYGRHRAPGGVQPRFDITRGRVTRAWFLEGASQAVIEVRVLALLDHITHAAKPEMPRAV